MYVPVLALGVRSRSDVLQARVMPLVFFLTVLHPLRSTLFPYTTLFRSSDNLGGILAVADYISRTRVAAGKEPLRIQYVLDMMIKAHEIQGVLALDNSLNRVGLDHVFFVKIATTAVVTKMLGGDRAEVNNALSNAWVDNSSLRTYRHAPNTGSRKSWAAGDATSRGVFLAQDRKS